MASKDSPEVDTKLAITDLECLKEAFALFDRDRDGEINTEELGKVKYLLAEFRIVCYNSAILFLMRKVKNYILM